MKKILLLLAPLAFTSVEANAEVINTLCVSPSGASTYKINIDTQLLEGALDYKFMGQEITYGISNAKLSNGVFSGVATFISSKTGEKRGNSFIFSYDIKKNIAKETNITYKCN